MNPLRRLASFPHYLASRVRARIAYEQEVFDLVANLDLARRSLAQLRAEHERLTKVCEDLRFENLQNLTATLDGEAS
jgi:hypothetical protein